MHYTLYSDSSLKKVHLKVRNHEEGPYTKAFSWLKAPTNAFTFKTLLRHYAKQILTGAFFVIVKSLRTLR